MSLFVVFRGPRHTRFPLRARGLFGFPVNDKTGRPKTFTGFVLPAWLRRRWADKIDVLLLAIDQPFGGDIPGINDMFAWQEIAVP